MGTQNQPFLAAHQWQAQISYQYAYTDQFYVGDQRDDTKGPHGQAPVRKVDLVNLDVVHALSDRVSLDLTLPFSSTSGGYVQDDLQFHDYHASGLGDISLWLDVWLSDPAKPSRFSGSVGLGLNAPTGDARVTGQFYTPAGNVEQSIDENTQLGSGGWGILVRAQGTARIAGSLFAYGSGYYLISLREHLDVTQGVLGPLRGVPDTYSGRLGFGYLLPVLQGLVPSLGGRINGVPVRDLVGGGDLYFRRPGYEIFVEPGLTWTWEANMASVSVPIRAYQNRLDSLLERSQNRHGGADFVSYLILASYAHRF